MMNLSTLPRSSLVEAFLAPMASDHNFSIPNVADECLCISERDLMETLLAYRLNIARELLLRDLHSQMRNKPMMDKPHALCEWLRLHCANLQHEVFLIVYLDARLHLITIDEMFRGTLTQTSVYPREVVKGALARNAACVAFAHNHPSGHPEPSGADTLLTQSLKSALSLVDVRVIDHFVVAGDQVRSFAELGLI